MTVFWSILNQYNKLIKCVMWCWLNIVNNYDHIYKNINSKHACHNHCHQWFKIILVLFVAMDATSTVHLAAPYAALETLKNDMIYFCCSENFIFQFFNWKCSPNTTFNVIAPRLSNVLAINKALWLIILFFSNGRLEYILLSIAFLHRSRWMCIAGLYGMILLYLRDV